MINEILSKLDGAEILGLCGILAGAVAILGGIAVAITQVVAAHYRRTYLDEMETTLKMEMISRGMSADEIKVVLEARSPRSRSSLGKLMAELNQGCTPRGRWRASAAGERRANS